MAAESLKDLIVRVFFGADEASASATEKRAAGVAATVSKAFAFNELKEAATGIFEIFHKGFEFVNETAKSAGDIGDLAGKIGVTTDQLQFLQFAFEDAGGSAATAEMSFRMMTQQIGMATTGSKLAVEAFQKVGVSIRDATGQLRDTGDVFNDVITSLGKIKNPTEQAAKAQQIFGRSWQDIRLLLKGGPEQLAALREEFDSLGLAITPEQVELGDRYGKAVRRLGRSWEEFKQYALEPVIKSFTGLIEKFLEWYKLNRLSVGEYAAKQFRDLMLVLKSFVTILKSLAPGADALHDAFERLTKKMGPWGGIVKAFGLILKLAFVSPKLALVALVAILVDDLLKFFNDTGPSAIGKFREIWDIEIARMRKSNHGFIADAMKAFGDFFAWMQRALAVQAEYLSTASRAFSKLLKGNASGFKDVEKLFNPAKIAAQADVKLLLNEATRKYDRLPPEALRRWFNDINQRSGGEFSKTPTGQALNVSISKMELNYTPPNSGDSRGQGKAAAENFRQEFSSEIRRTHAAKVHSKR